MGRGDGKVTLKIIVSTLYLLSVSSVSETIFTTYLFAKREADSTISISLIFVFVSVWPAFLIPTAVYNTDLKQSLLSILYGLLHSFLARRLRSSESRTLPRTQLYSTAMFMPRLLITVWMASAAAGLVVAARQPACLPGHEGYAFWKFGTSCDIHRATVGLAVAAL